MSEGLGATGARRIGRGGWAAAVAVLLIATPARTFAQTPAAPAPSALPAVSTEFSTGAPHVETVAQGVTDLAGPVVWRVREVSLAPNGGVEAGPTSFTLQRTGASTIRDEQTGRRARLEPGEAYFIAGNAPYSRSAEGSDQSSVWIIELVPPDVASQSATGTVLFASQPIQNYPQGAFDTELHRGVLLPNESSELPSHTGPALLMIASGRVEATVGANPPQTIGAGAGMMVDGPISLRDVESAPASFVLASFGDQLQGSEAAAPTATQAPAAPAVTPAPLVPEQQTSDQQPQQAQTQPQPDQSAAQAQQPASGQVNPAPGDTDGDGLSDADEARLGSDPLNKDYDADGLLDGAEVYQYGTDPVNNDTDGDGLLDGEEINQYGTSPTAADTDGDGLSDADEIYRYGSNPTVYDTDGDGHPDGEEIIVDGTDPTDPNSHP
jgi:thrombospondin type 3 repeat protein